MTMGHPWWHPPEGEMYGPVYTIPIQPDLVIGILAAEASDLMWVELPNGDRLVAFYPQEEGSEYYHCQADLDTGRKVVSTVEATACITCDERFPQDEGLSVCPNCAP